MSTEILQELQKLQQKYQLLIERNPLAVIEWNKNFEVVAWNPEAEKVFGYSTSEAMGTHALKMIVTSDVKPHVEQVLQEFKNLKGGTCSVNTNLTKNGKIITCEWYNIPLVDENEEFAGVISMVQDITEKDLAETALKQSVLQYRTIFDAVSDGILLFEAETAELIEGNSSACQMHGYSYEEFIHLKPESYIHPDSIHKFASFIEIVRTDGEFTCEAVDIKKDGTTFDIEVRATKCIYNGKPHCLGVLRDISEQKSIQKERQQTQRTLERYVEIIDSSSDAIIIRSFDGVVTYWNQGAEKLYGWTKKDAIGKITHELFQTIFPKPLEEILTELKLTGYWSGELIHITREKTQVTVFSRWCLQPDETGEFSIVLETNNNITERKEAEKKQARLLEILEATSDIIGIADAQGNNIYLNKAGQNIFGISQESDKFHISICHPPRITEKLLAEAIPIAAKEGIWTGESAVISHDGKEIPVSQVIIAHKEGSTDVKYFSTIMRDITVIEQTKTALKEKEERLRNINNLVPGAIYQYVFNLNTHDAYFSYLSPKTRELFELDESEQLENKNPIIELIHPEDVPRLMEGIIFVALHKKPWLDEFRIITRSGKQKWIQGQSEPAESSKGLSLHNGVFIDITERKLAEQKIKEQAEDLEKALNSLRHTQSQLIHSEKMSSLGQLVAGIAHEINNPIGFIYSNIQPAKEYIDDLFNLINLYQDEYPNPSVKIQNEIETIELKYLMEDLPKSIYSMKMGAERIKKIVLSLRNFSRKDEADYKQVDIHEGLDSTLMILEHRLKIQSNRPAVKVIKEYNSLPLVECYAGQLNQVFMNILNNAIDALDEAFVKDNSKYNSPQIYIKTQLTATNRVSIAIEDNGFGIPEDIRGKLFDPFFSTKDIGKGTGLGLSTSYQMIVGTHHGKIWCDSIPGEGSNFVLEIPTQLQKPSANAPSVTKSR